jgi:primosomal protein N' (replication factor Y)
MSPPPSVCPSCGASDWRYVGSGSERLAEQLASSFPRASVTRVDPDVLAGDAPREARQSEADIYVTTWIGTKDVLRPEVSLVAVLDADALIRRPDFRASERAYQALAEMAEWAGPAAEGGRLFVQTAEPAHHAVQAVARADYSFWLRRELEHRAELGYPPFSELVKITAGGPRAESLIEEAARICRVKGARVLGPIGVRLGAGAARQVLIKAADANPIAEELRPLAAKVAPGDRLQVDVDPR